MSKTKEQRALTQAHSRAADLLGEIYEDPDVMEAIRKASPDMADEITDCMKEWRSKGQAFLESVHKTHLEAR